MQKRCLIIIISHGSKPTRLQQQLIPFFPHKVNQSSSISFSLICCSSLLLINALLFFILNGSTSGHFRLSREWTYPVESGTNMWLFCFCFSWFLDSKGCLQDNYRCLQELSESGSNLFKSWQGMKGSHMVLF